MSVLHRHETPPDRSASPDPISARSASPGADEASTATSAAAPPTAASAKAAAQQAREAAEAALVQAEAAEAEALQLEEREIARRAAAEEAEAAEQQAAEAEAIAATARARATDLRASVTGEGTSESATDNVDLTKRPTSDDADADRPQVAGKRRVRRFLHAIATRRAAGFGAAVVVLLALCTLSGVMIISHRDVVDNRSRAADFTAAARQGVLNVTSLDYRNARRDVERISKSSTGAFGDDFAQRSGAFISVVEQSKVTTVGTVTADGIESMDDDSAVVLVSATSTVSNAAGAKEEPRVWRLRVDVSRVGGDYKMSKVEFVP